MNKQSFRIRNTWYAENPSVPNSQLCQEPGLSLPLADDIAAQKSAAEKSRLVNVCRKKMEKLTVYSEAKVE